MPNLLEIHDYAIDSNNEDAMYITSKYIDMSKWNRGQYVLGGQIVLKPQDNITENIIKEMQSLLYYSEGHHWNTCDIITALENKDINIIVELIEEIRIQKIRMNGLLRSIVFWLSPARKRATEYVFHPSRINLAIDI